MCLSQFTKPQGSAALSRDRELSLSSTELYRSWQGGADLHHLRTCCALAACLSFITMASACLTTTGFYKRPSASAVSLHSGCVCRGWGGSGSLWKWAPQAQPARSEALPPLHPVVKSSFFAAGEGVADHHSQVRTVQCPRPAGPRTAGVCLKPQVWGGAQRGGRRRVTAGKVQLCGETSGWTVLAAISS